jgi:catechol 2,3-dioxygenase
MKLPENTKIQSVNLKIRDLESSLNYYSGMLGFKEIERQSTSGLLSADGKLPALLELHEDKNAKPIDRQSTGLYHIAIRFPSRKALAEVFMHLFNNNTKFHGFSDHLVSEAIYLADPDGNGIELYVDKPKNEWKWNNGQIEMETLPLNLALITHELGENPPEWKGIHPDTMIGHIHLRVSNLIKAERFYNGLLGFNVTTRNYPGALFFSAGGYHHHIGTNTWSVQKTQHDENNSLGLISYTISIPDRAALDEIKSKAESRGIEIETLSPAGNQHSFYIKDFDNNKIKLTL